MKRCALVLIVPLAGCAARSGGTKSSCSDPLGLYTSPAYEVCCHGHDVAYRVGGDEGDRLKADQAFYCLYP